MYVEKKRIRINWVSLIVKLIILILIVIVILFIVKGCQNKKFLSRKITTTEYTNGMSSMKDAAMEYFTNDRLPKKVGATNVITLREMLDQKILLDFTNNGRLCKIDDSYAQVTRTSDNNYALKINLDCEGHTDFIVTTIENKEELCKTTKCGEATTVNESTTESKTTNNNSSSSTSQSSSSSSSSSKTTSSSSSSSSKSTSSSSKSSSSSRQSSSTSSTNKSSNTTIINQTIINVPCNSCCTNCAPSQPKTVTYYKHVKYSKWTTDVLTGSNVETKTENVEYNTTCPIAKTKTIYATAVMSHHTLYNSTHSFEVNISKHLKNAGYNYQISSVSYFDSSTDYNNYLNQASKPIFIIGDTIHGDVCIDDYSSMKSATLTKAHYTINPGQLYKNNGTYYLPMQMTYKNANGIEPICNCATREKVFFLPFKINVNYTVDKTCTKEKTVTFYREYTYKWTTNQYEEGYTYTGIKEIRTI